MLDKNKSRIDSIRTHTAPRRKTIALDERLELPEIVRSTTMTFMNTGSLPCPVFMPALFQAFRTAPSAFDMASKC